MKAGACIVWVAFGDHFDDLAAKSASYSRRFTRLPFVVMTNMIERSKVWDSVGNVEFKVFDMRAGLNREIKTSLPYHIGYEKGIYIDADATIQGTGIERVVSDLDECDVALRLYGRYRPGHRLLSYYTIAFRRLGIRLPIDVYYGAFVAFNNNQYGKTFFDAWSRAWKLSMIHREMPALAAAAKRTRDAVAIREYGESDNIFAYAVNNDAIIQHEYGNGRLFWERFWSQRGVRWDLA